MTKVWKRVSLIAAAVILLLSLIVAYIYFFPAQNICTNGTPYGTYPTVMYSPGLNFKLPPHIREKMDNFNNKMYGTYDELRAKYGESLNVHTETERGNNYTNVTFVGTGVNSDGVTENINIKIETDLHIRNKIYVDYTIILYIIFAVAVLTVTIILLGKRRRKLAYNINNTPDSAIG